MKKVIPFTDKFYSLFDKTSIAVNLSQYTAKKRYVAMFPIHPRIGMSEPTNGSLGMHATPSPFPERVTGKVVSVSI